jgi:hypothetical protein
MQDVNAGLKLLEENFNLLAALETNVRRTYKAIAKMKGKQDELRIRLEWPSALTGGDGATVADP